MFFRFNIRGKLFFLLSPQNILFQVRKSLNSYNAKNCTIFFPKKKSNQQSEGIR